MPEHVDDGGTLNADEFALQIGVPAEALEDLWGEWSIARFEEDRESRYPSWQLADGSILNTHTHRLLAHASEADVSPQKLHEWMVATGAAGEFAADPDGVIARFDAEHGI